MNNYAYTQDQVAQALLNQGYSSEEATRMAKAIGNVEKQDSNILPNLAEASAYAGVSHLIDKKAHSKSLMRRTVPKMFLAGIPASLAYMGTSALTGNNYADKASLSQFAGDTIGGIAGSMLGETFGKAIAKKAGAAALGNVLGRAFGATAGGPLAPITSIIGGTIGSWLVPKLFTNSDEQFLEPDKGISGGTAATLAGLGLVASPLGRPLRKSIDNQLMKVNGYNDIKDAATKVKDVIGKKMPNAVQRYADAYNKPLIDYRNSKLASGTPLDDTSWGLRSLGYNTGETLRRYKSLDGVVERFGEDIGSLFLPSTKAQP